MNNLTSIIEAIVFASGLEVPVKYIIEKLGCSLKEVNAAISELKEKYGADSGVVFLTFNGKIQLATNPALRSQVSEVLQPIKEKELSKTILECAAIIAYKQPITKPELEEIRQVSCDYAIHTLLELEMITPCGRKDVVGKPILYATTDNFLKRFRLNSLDELPDYDELMQQIASLNGARDEEDDDSNYLYKKDEYVEESQEETAESGQKTARTDSTDSAKKAESEKKYTEDGYELPDFLDGNGDDDDDGGVITIK